MNTVRNIKFCALNNVIMFDFIITFLAHFKLYLLRNNMYNDKSLKTQFATQSSAFTAFLYMNNINL